MTELTACPSDEGLLLRELTHRISNEYAAIINSISLAAARSPHREVKVALNEAMETLHSHADVYRSLKIPTPGTQVDVAVYLGNLCDAISRSKLKHTGAVLELVSARVTLVSEQAWRLGLIVYELVTNAARHGLRGSVGTIHVELTCTDESLRCKVTDNGLAPPHIGGGQGLKIISRLAKDLGGTVECNFEAHGSRCIVVLPLAGLTARPGRAIERRNHGRTTRSAPVLATNRSRGNSASSSLITGP
jgi:two-component sensor histidine kinase